ncbi:MAG: hypothetical protein ABIW79_04495 [Gemmatimonas sp.]
MSDAPRPRSGPAPRRREGFLLPLVLVALLLVATLASATGLGAWRAMRAARLAWNGERAVQAADEAIASTMATWDGETFAARDVGARWSASVNTANGGSVAVNSVRLSPLVVAIDATSQSRVRGSPDTAGRRVARVLALEPPRFPLPGALTVLGDATIDEGALLDGRDESWMTDGCGPTRDTASVPGVYAGIVSVNGAPRLFGAPSVIALGSAPALDPERAIVDGALTQARSRITRRDALVAPSSLPPRVPWTARIVTGVDLLAPGRVTLLAASSHEGLVLIDGDLRLQGTLRVRGLLLVTGSVNAQDGALEVDGGVLVRDSGALGSWFGMGVRVRHSPCLIGRALATIARPRIAPFSLWAAR